jgi:cell wall-associated NlpC family hydrolase
VRSLRVMLCALLCAAAVATATPAQPALAETPARKIARLRAEATRVQRTIDRMNDQIERLVEDYNANQEALAQTAAAERQTVQRLRDAERRLRAAQLMLDQRVRAIYVLGPTTGLDQLLGSTDVHDAVTRVKYQTNVVAADRNAILRVDDARTLLRSIAAELAGQRRAQERLRERLARQRAAIQARLDAQRRYLARVNQAVKRAVAAERRRQEALRRQALLRRLAAERAARARAARSRAGHWVPRFRGGGTGAARAAVAFAMAQLGKPYLWGAVGPGSYDCSGLTMTAYAHAGVSLPRTSRSQWYAGPHVDLVDLAPGDLLFFADNLSAPSTIHHVGIYAGRGLMVEAPYSGASVRMGSIGRGDFIGAVRPTG